MAKRKSGLERFHRDRSDSIRGSLVGWKARIIVKKPRVRGKILEQWTKKKNKV